MSILSKGMDFKSEEGAIREQVSQGRRCADCLRLFNGGERKVFKPGTESVICQNCSVEGNACNNSGKEAGA